MTGSFWPVLAMTTAAGLSTGLGGLLAVLARPAERLLAASLGFAAGVMVTVSLADLAPGALAYYRGALSDWGAGGALASLFCMGMLLAALLDRCLPDEQALSRLVGGGRRGRALRTALVTGLALLLHNLPEGVLTLFAGVADPRLGLRTALAIALHNIPEGIALAEPFYYATHSRGRALALALLSGLAEPVGALLAWGLLSPWLTPGFLNGLMVLVAGIMTWVAAAELMPAGLGLGHGRAAAAGFGAGVVLMLAGIAAMG